MVIAQYVIDDTSSLEEMVEAIGNAVQSGMVVSEAVDQVLPTVTMSRDVELEMIRKGWITYVNDMLHNMRRASRKDGNGTKAEWSFSAKFMARPLTGASARADVLRRIWLEGATGYQKSLLAFKLADCEHFMQVANGQIKGWTTKRDAMKSAISKLSVLDADKTIADLPISDLNAMADIFDVAWP